MAMKLAFSTVACPEWTIEQVAKNAQAFGYDGVELRTLGSGGACLASDPALGNPKKVRDSLGECGIEPVCLSTGLYAHHSDHSATRQAQLEIAENLKLAAEIGCSFVQAFPGRPLPNQDRRSMIHKMASSLRPLSEKAADLGVRLVLENEPAFSAPKEWWWLIESIGDPVSSICWNLPNAAAANENDKGGVVAVPTLNSRIQLAKAYDAVVGPSGGFAPMGQGNVGVEQFIKRLMGIGYQGYLSIEWNRVWFEALSPAEEFLPEAHQAIRGWIDNINQATTKEVKGKAAKDKSAAATGS